MGKKDRIGLFLLRILETERSIRVFEYWVISRMLVLPRGTAQKIHTDYITYKFRLIMSIIVK